METTIVYRGYIGIMQNKMETTIHRAFYWAVKELKLSYHNGYNGESNGK